MPAYNGSSWVAGSITAIVITVAVVTTIGGVPDMWVAGLFAVIVIIAIGKVTG